MTSWRLFLMLGSNSVGICCRKKRECWWEGAKKPNAPEVGMLLIPVKFIYR